MADLGIGAGIGTVGFWLFIGMIVVGGMWYSIRERDAKHETLRRMIESGAPVDEALRDQLLGVNRRLDRDLRVSGLIVLATGPGLAVLGAFLRTLAPEAFLPLLGVGVLVVFIGVGLMVAARYVARDEAGSTDRSPG